MTWTNRQHEWFVGDICDDFRNDNGQIDMGVNVNASPQDFWNQISTIADPLWKSEVDGSVIPSCISAVHNKFNSFILDKRISGEYDSVGIPRIGRADSEEAIVISVHVCGHLANVPGNRDEKEYITPIRLAKLAELNAAIHGPNPLDFMNLVTDTSDLYFQRNP